MKLFFYLVHPVHPVQVFSLWLCVKNILRVIMENMTPPRYSICTNHGVVLGVILYTLLVGWFSWQNYPIGETRSVENDFFAWYVPNAEKILHGDGFNLKEYRYNPPGYSIALALVGALTRNLFAAGKVISLCASALALLSLYAIWRKMLPGDLACWAVLATAVNPWFIHSSYYVGTDMLFMALSCLTVSTLLSPHPCRAALAGILTGLAYWVRYNGLFLIPAGILAVYFLDGETSVRQRRLRIGVYLSAFAVTVLPWHVFLLLREGSFFFNRNYMNMAYDFLHADMNKDYFSQFVLPHYQSIFDVVFSEPSRFTLNVLRNFQAHLTNQIRFLTPEYLKWFAIPGFYWLVRSLFEHGSQVMPRRLLVFSWFCYFSLMGLIHYEHRYFLYLMPFYSLVYIYGLYKIAQIIAQKKEPIKAAILAGALVFVGTESVAAQYRDVKSFNTETLKIAEFLGYFSGTPARIMSRSANIAYFSKIPYKFMPVLHDEEELYQYARANGAGLVFYTEIESDIRPALKDLLFRPRFFPGLQKIMEWRQPHRRSVVYRVLSGLDSNGFMELNKENFASAETWGGLQIPNANSVRVVLEGLLVIKQAGVYTLAFSGDDFALSLDEKTVLDDKDKTASFMEVPVDLQSGTHTLRLETRLKPGNIIPAGLFWRTPDGKREAIPRSALMFTSTN